MASDHDVHHYEERFDPDAYLIMCFKFVQEYAAPLEVLKTIFDEIDLKENSKYLDYGAGPTIVHAISATGNPSISEVYFAEYTTGNRKAMQKWFDQEKDAFDWLPFFRYVVENLEGNSKGTVNRVEKLRRNTKAIVPCDITKERIIAENYEGPYDVISVVGVFARAKNRDEFQCYVNKICKLLAPGGFLIIGWWEPGVAKCDDYYYTIGSEVFRDLTLDKQFVSKSMENAGLINVRSKRAAWEVADAKDGYSGHSKLALNFHWGKMK